MTKAGKPWGSRDIDEPTRAALLQAAEKSGLTMTDWDAAAGGRAAAGAGRSSPGTAAAGAEDGPASRRLREAIAGLTGRLSGLDQAARAGVVALPMRLAEIEHRLAALNEAVQTGKERTRAQSETAFLINVLVRDLDKAAQRAKAGDTAQMPPAQTALPPPPAAAHEPDEEFADRPAVEPETTSEQAAQLNEIRFRLDALLNGEEEHPAEPEPPPRAARPEVAHRADVTRADPAEAPPSPTVGDPAHSAAASGAADQIRGLETQLAEILARLPPRRDADLAAAVREISAHQRVIDNHADAAAMRREQQALTAAVAALHADVAALGERIAFGSSDGNDAGAILELARRIDALAAAQAPDQGLLAEIRSELDGMRAALASGPQRAIGPLEARVAELVERVEDALARAPDGERIDALGEEVAALRQAIEAGAGSAGYDRLEARVDQLQRLLEVPRQDDTVERVDQRLAYLQAMLEAGRSDEATERLEQRLAEIQSALEASRQDDAAERLEQRLDDLQVVVESSHAEDQADRLEERLVELQRTFAAALSAQPGTVALPAPVDVGGIEERLEALADSIAALGDRYDATSAATSPDGEELAEVGARLDGIAADLAHLLERGPAAAPREDFSVLDGRLAQLATGINSLLARDGGAADQTMLDRLEARLTEVADGVTDLLTAPAGGDLSAPTKHLDRRLDEIARALAAAPAVASAAVPAAGLGRVEQTLARLADDVRTLTEATAAPPAAAQHLDEKLDAIGAAVAGLARRAPPTTEVEALHARLQGLTDRIDRLQFPPSSLASDLDDIRTEVASIRAVHQRLQTLTERIDGIAAVQHQPLLAIGEIKDGIASIRSMHERMQSLTDRLDRISSAQRGPLPGMERMEAAVAAIADMGERLEGLALRINGGDESPREMVAEMRASMAAIHDVSEQMRSLADKISGMAVQRAPVAVLEDIKRDITMVRTEVAARRAPNLEPLEKMIAELGRQITGIRQTPGTDTEEVAELARQMSHLADEVDDARPRIARLQQVEERVERMQTYFQDTRLESVEAARVEARAAVRELQRMVIDGEVDASVVGTLIQDLDALKNSATENERRLRSRVDAVNTTLAQVVARLSQLEADRAGGPLVDPRAERPPQRAVEAVPPAAAASEPTRPPEVTLPPSAGTAPLPATAVATAPVAPPPSAAAALAAGGADAVAASTAVETDKDSRAQRADFIAAARRAAQAAAAEAEKPTGEGGGDEKPGRLARLSQTILNRKRTMVLAAAGLGLALATVGLMAVRLAGRPATPEVAALAAPAMASPAGAAAATVPAAPPTVSGLVAPATVDRALAFAAPVAGSPFMARTRAQAQPATDVAVPAVSDARVTVAATGIDPTTTAAIGDGIDPAIGSATLTRSALGGNPLAAFEVAARYAAGDHVKRDLAKAAQWYERAAAGGIGVAQYRLGNLLERGQGVAKDLVTAIAWYQRAADQGNVNAMHNLAVLLNQGVDGPPQREKALHWFQAAADYGLRDSQYNLGVIYARGLGVAADLPQSYRWFALAAQQGDADAAARRDEIAAMLAADELAEARAAVAGWRARPVISDANRVNVPAGGWDGSNDLVSDAERQTLVRTIQTLLAEQGYDPGPADGLLGPKTRQAVRDFQRKTGVEETGQVDASLLAALDHIDG